MTASPDIDPPIGMLAELTHRCPLHCPYCSNPVELERRSAELSTDDWKRVFTQAADLGVLQVHLSGGEPTARRDIVEIVAHCNSVGLYTNLITAAVGVKPETMDALADAGLDHVQISFEGVKDGPADRIAGLDGAHAAKRKLAAQVIALDIPLTVNAVIHRANIHLVEDMVRAALGMGARRVEVAHTQYYGWALRNREALMPAWDQVETALQTVETLRRELAGQIVIDAVVPDYYARLPKPCVGGWGRRSLNVTPSGKVLPCHAAESIPGLVFDNVAEKPLAEIWQAGQAFNAFRGTDWMPDLCRTCERRDIDFGGCRCQAMAIAGDATATDPACAKSPLHQRLVDMAQDAAGSDVTDYDYRRFL
ncbi:MAG: pyrroloquinoline quinone biosynthesis protein PqqE [Minwuia sp.]|uniref:pyrroloquinoline quinone biosynthesis protein PqqE n=1 Tax=Minwuia sp. TaxID=2493630 RepID=UPI003A8A8C2F